ncbi:porin family protein [Pseudohalocynthiibacter aestuariivivens]|uniref:Porin family protein n=1 Tax=Roseovarius pelagicus TaxID=2980108 RepID=A0ABY6DDZ9_9RHOB|nr:MULTISPECIES: porin [Rhodobacterales]QIE44899.1 porin family protein [Pseudohalocynthiibacter aestuariivivens]UXX83203.1 porin family protein [Roseovarius pelagicus]
MFRKATLIVAALSTSVALPAFAGSPEPVVVEPAITPAAPVVAVGPDWTGFYAGAQLGYADVDTNVANVDGDDMIGGLTAGYDWDLGKYVVGVGADYDFADVGLSPTNSLDSIWRLKMRSGVKIGDGLLYLSGGYAHVDTSGFGDEGGKFYGAGYEHMMTENISVGGEVLHHEFDNVGATANDVDATTYQVRATFRF